MRVYATLATRREALLLSTTCLTGLGVRLYDSVPNAREPQASTVEATERTVAEATRSSSGASHQLSNHQAVDLQEENTQRPHSRVTSPHSAERSGPTAVPNQGQDGA